jgi:hypothetical protein
MAILGYLDFPQANLNTSPDYFIVYKKKVSFLTGVSGLPPKAGGL